jgi:hypothetical protein
MRGTKQSCRGDFTSPPHHSSVAKYAQFLITALMKAANHLQDFVAARECFRLSEIFIVAH